MPTTTDAVLSVADILERELDATIEEWLQLVEKEPDIARIKLNFQERNGHAPALLRDVIARLRLDNRTRVPVSAAARHHGELRRKQGYTVAMVVDECRALQVSIFSTLHRNTEHVDFDKLLPDVMIIADEAEAQLQQQVLGFWSIPPKPNRTRSRQKRSAETPVSAAPESLQSRLWIDGSCISHSE